LPDDDELRMMEEQQLPHLKGTEAAFATAEFADRCSRARKAIAAAGHDGLIVTGPENIYWLTGRQSAGYFAFQALIMPSEGDPVLLVRQLEFPGAVANSQIATILCYQDGEDPADILVKIIKEAGFASLAMELAGWFVSPLMVRQIEEKLNIKKLPDGSHIMLPLRLVKSPVEIAAIRMAAIYTEAAISAALQTCGEASNENAIAAAMIHAAIGAGSEAMAMEPLVASGPRSGLPHMTWRRRCLKKGDPVFLECAASHARYHAALMRTAWIGSPPRAAQKMMDCALAALDAALSTMRPGVACYVPHEAAQHVINEAGYEAAFRKRVGYSMGIAFAPDWGEGALLSLFSGNNQVLEAGMVFHLPVTLRNYGVWTVGASETVIVTPTGIEILSNLPRQITSC